MSAKQSVTIADVEGPWIASNWDSGLVARCKHGWNTPISQLTNEMLATYLGQKIALSLLIPEAQKRIAERFSDDTELYEEQLEEALQKAARKI